MKNLIIGLVFALLWSSASVATKFGLAYVAPLILANIRFFIAGIPLLVFTYALQRGPEYRLPRGREWLQLTVFALLNTTLFLGLYVWAMKYTSAGIGSLAVATNPLLITLMSSLWLGRKPALSEIAALVLGLSGVALATYPLLGEGHTSLNGILILMVSMLMVSAASVYYASVKWELPNLLINGWQVLIGGLALLPFTCLFSDFSDSRFDSGFWFPVLWLSLAVSVGALICWFYLLKADTVKASLWLFLCPVFGFYYAWLLMDEPITPLTVAGTGLVIVALLLPRISVYLKPFFKH